MCHNEAWNFFRTDTSVKLEKGGASSTAHPSAERNDDAGYRQRDGNLFLIASKAVAASQSSLDGDVITVPGYDTCCVYIKRLPIASAKCHKAHRSLQSNFALYYRWPYTYTRQPSSLQSTTVVVVDFTVYKLLRLTPNMLWFITALPLLYPESSQSIACFWLGSGNHWTSG